METLFAVLVVLVCVALLVRMALPERMRQRVDWQARRSLAAVRHGALHLWHWRDRRRRASHEAEAAIRRARGEVERDGNLIRPKAFKGPNKPH
jgi:hypothetical protein